MTASPSDHAALAATAAVTSRALRATAQALPTRPAGRAKRLQLSVSTALERLRTERGTKDESLAATVGVHRTIVTRWRDPRSGRSLTTAQLFAMDDEDLVFTLRELLRQRRELGMSRAQVHVQLTLGAGLDDDSFLRSLEGELATVLQLVQRKRSDL